MIQIQCATNHLLKFYTLHINKMKVIAGQERQHFDFFKFNIKYFFYFDCKIQCGPQAKTTFAPRISK